jgi:hypothetical protein
MLNRLQYDYDREVVLAAFPAGLFVLGLALGDVNTRLFPDPGTLHAMPTA